MSVWIIWGTRDPEDQWLEGVFSSEESAREYVSRYGILIEGEGSSYYKGPDVTYDVYEELVHERPPTSKLGPS